MSKTDRARNTDADDGPDDGREMAWRRYVRRLVVERGEPVTVAAAADRVLSREAAAGADVPSWEEVHSRLYHRTLPALTNRGIVAFDGRRGVIEPVGETGHGRTGETSRPARWSWYGLVVCVAGTATVGLSALRVVPFDGVPLTGLLAVCIVLFAALTVVGRRHPVTVEG